jgi:DNA mismatch endonuclease (patch repair protein)
MGYEKTDRSPPAPVVSEQRSAIMRSVGSKNTGLELALRKALWRRGFRYRLHPRVEGTRPDLVFPGAKVAVFVDGCFWHGCPRHYAPPKTNVDFWTRKLETNVDRDTRDTLRLEAAGWTVLRFWGCQIGENLGGVVDAVEALVRREAP